MGNRALSRARGLWAAGFTGVQVGAAMVATRAIADQLGPMTLALLRYGVAVVILLPFFLRLNAPALARADRWPVLALGVVQFGVLIAFLNVGLTRVTAGQGAVLFATFPLMTMALAALLGKEALGWRKSLGALISILGVALCLGVSTLPSDPLGVAAILAAALCGAVCSIFYRPYLQRYPTLQIGTVAMVAAVIALLPGAALEGPLTALASLTASGWAIILFIGLSSGVGYLLWLTALKYAAPTEATVLLGLSPVTAALLGRILLHEPTSLGFWLGILTVLIGVTLAVTAGRKTSLQS